MIQKLFAEQAVKILQQDPEVLGLAVGGSWLVNEIDEYSDLDLILVTRDRISNDPEKMQVYARRLGSFLSGFTGEHVGESRLLICLYRDPLLHVDIKFLTLEEFHVRVENPEILWERDQSLSQVIHSTEAVWPKPDFQWIEDRFWTWVHYALLKIGRGEYMEAADFFSFLRHTVLGPLLHIKNGKPARGVRKVEVDISTQELSSLIQTIPRYERGSLLESLAHAIQLYLMLREDLYDESIRLHKNVEQEVIKYFKYIQEKV